MKNSPQNWATAATIVAVSLVEAGCKHSTVSTNPYRPVTNIPDASERSMTANAIRDVLETSDAPIPPAPIDEEFRRAASKIFGAMPFPTEEPNPETKAK